MAQEKINIVIADDNLNIRQTLKDILIEKGYCVDVVKDGYELLDYLKKDRSAHIIILDLLMPVKDGLEIIFSIKSVSPETKIIIYTGFKKYENSVYARAADRFLLKSESPAKLLQTIRELI